MLPDPSELSIKCWERINGKGQPPCLAFLKKECKSEPDGTCPKGYFCHDITFTAAEAKEVLKHEKALRKRSTSRTLERTRSESKDSAKGGGKGDGKTRKGGKGGGKSAEAATLLDASVPFA